MNSYGKAVFVGLIFLISTTSAQQCRSIGRQAGECVEITKCPILFQRLLRKTISDIKLLQKLTCVTDPDAEPIVCCPFEEIDRMTFSSPVVEPPNNLRSHPHFSQIPELKNCSAAVVTDRIIGGKNVSHGTYPWMARIGYKNKLNGKIEYYCGGSIISKRYILTAAHCSQGFDENYTLAQVRLGEHDENVEEDCNRELGNICSTPQDFQIEKAIVHNEYNSASKQNDISLLKVDRDISFESYFIRPVCLPFFKEYAISSPDAYNFGYVAGWGRVQWNKAEGSHQLLEVKLPVIPNQKCREIYKRRVRISDKQLCAGGVNGKDSCGGDSGGPLMTSVRIPNTIDKFFQLGIVSFGPVQCGVGGLPGVYNRVSEYLNWILDNMEP